ncbi:MAG TPA: TraB/GumN family protein [Verrucomicrobiales bacterium]|nr:TraB/GumN family protein [Verrucomicrobiales bacterium]
MNNGLRLVVGILLWGWTSVVSGVEQPHLVWEALNGNTRVYLIGSIHALHQDDYPLPGAMSEAYRRAERVVFEIDFSEVTEVSVSTLSTRHGLYRRNESIRDHLSAENYRKLSRYFVENNLGPTPDQAKPWLFSTTLLQTELSKLGLRGDLGVDSHFYGRALNESKPVSGLETLALQYSVLSGQDPERQIADLEQFLDSSSEMLKQEVIKIFDVWRAADEKALIDAYQELLKEDPGFFDLLLTKRNLSWMPQIEEFLSPTDSTDTLVVVGALHMVGELGLINLLRNQGYDVERFPRSPDGIPAPEFTNIAQNGATWTLSMNIEIGRSYTLQSSTDLNSWADEQVLFADDQEFKLDWTPSAPLTDSVFFRLRTP